MELRPEVLAKIAAAPVPTAEMILSSRIAIASSTRHGGDRRGSSANRRRRTEKLLQEFGNGITCPCSYCGVTLTAATLTQDKIYPGDMGGGYRYDNLIPACIACNRKRSDAAIHEFIAEAEAAIAAAKELLSS